MRASIVTISATERASPTSRQFISDAVNGVDPDRRNEELEFLRLMLSEIVRLSEVDFEGVGKGAAIIKVDEHGRLLP